MKKTNPDIRDALFEEIYKLGKKDKNVVFITDDLDAFLLRKFKNDFPSQFINIGVAEQNMMDVAAGLSTCGKKVFTYGICTYVTMRSYEQIKLAICSMNLGVVIIGLGPGFSFSFDGSTHHGIQDVGVMRILPEMTIYNPCDAISAKVSVSLAYKSQGPVYIRLDKGIFPKIYHRKDDFSEGFKIISPLSSLNIISTGFMTPKGFELVNNLKKKGLQVGLVDLFRLKPVSKKFLTKVIKKSKQLITLEENSIVGGLGSIISEIICDNQLDVKLKRLAIIDRQFSVFGSREWLLKLNSLDIESIEKKILGHMYFNA